MIAGYLLPEHLFAIEVVLSYHKSIACLYLHQPDFDIIHHVIYGVTFFIQGHSSKNLEWCWPSGAAVVLGEDHQRIL